MTPENNILIVTPRMEELAALCRSNTLIEAGLYREYDVKRGLRDVNGKGVLAGLTNISDIIAQREVDGILQPCPGELYYRGIRIEELVQGFVREGRISAAVRQTARRKGARQLQEPARAGAHAADQFHARRYHEGADARHDEQPVPQRADARLL